MDRRVCVMAVANDMLSILLPLLPGDVEIIDRMACFDRDTTILKLEGPGLPEWCKAPTDGSRYASASAIIGFDGILYFAPLPADGHPSALQRLQHQFGNPN